MSISRLVLQTSCSAVLFVLSQASCMCQSGIQVACGNTATINTTSNATTT